MSVTYLPDSGQWNACSAGVISTITQLNNLLTITPVDGARLFELECQTINRLHILLNHLESTAFERVYLNATGFSSWFWCLRRIIDRREDDRAWVQFEIDALRRSDPVAGEALQRYLNERWAVPR
jgi:hypothetical protein